MNNYRNFFNSRTLACFCGLSVALAACDSGTSSSASVAKTDASGDTAGGDTAAKGDTTGSDTKGSDTAGNASSDTSSDTASVVAFELIGTWSTPYGTDDVITQTKWNTATIVEFDNAADVAFTQEPADDPYNPNKFNKVIWTEPKNNSFYYCIVDYGKDSLVMAKASTLTADASDPDNKGCGGSFPWTKATKK